MKNPDHGPVENNPGEKLTLNILTPLLESFTFHTFVLKLPDLTLQDKVILSYILSCKRVDGFASLVPTRAELERTLGFSVLAVRKSFDALISRGYVKFLGSYEKSGDNTFIALNSEQIQKVLGETFAGQTGKALDVVHRRNSKGRVTLEPVKKEKKKSDTTKRIEETPPSETAFYLAALFADTVLANHPVPWKRDRVINKWACDMEDLVIPECLKFENAEPRIDIANVIMRFIPDPFWGMILASPTKLKQNLAKLITKLATENKGRV